MGLRVRVPQAAPEARRVTRSPDPLPFRGAERALGRADRAPKHVSCPKPAVAPRIRMLRSAGKSREPHVRIALCGTPNVPRLTHWLLKTYQPAPSKPAG